MGLLVLATVMRRETPGKWMLLLISFTALCLPCSVRGTEPSKNWVSFSSKAGWCIKYPSNWQIGSCNGCADPTAPRVFVSFFDPTTGGMITIQRLRDKPADQSVEMWLNDVKRIAVANPQISEDWMLLAGTRALKVRTRNPDSTESENIYAVEGSRTFFIQASPLGNTAFCLVYEQVLSSFRFTKQ